MDILEAGTSTREIAYRVKRISDGISISEAGRS